MSRKGKQRGKPRGRNEQEAAPNKNSADVQMSKRPISWKRRATVITFLCSAVALVSYLIVIFQFASGQTTLPSLFKPDPKEKQELWLVIHESNGQPSSGARIAALERLTKLGESLGGIDLHGCNLDYISLKGADLKMANLMGASLQGADLTGANLGGANLDDANLVGAQMSKAQLNSASVRSVNSRARLDRVNLSEGVLLGANFTGAELVMADLSKTNAAMCVFDGARMWRAKLKDAMLVNSSLKGADLSLADLNGITWVAVASAVIERNALVTQQRNGGPLYPKVEGMNLYGILNAPADFLDWARNNGAVFNPPKPSTDSGTKLGADPTFPG